MSLTRCFLAAYQTIMTRWIKATEMDLQELISLKQFLTALPRGVAVWLREQKPTCATKAAEMADDYEVARKSEGGVSGSAPSQKPISAPKTSSASFFQPQRSKTNHRGEIQCHWCKEWGHIQAVCPQRQTVWSKSHQQTSILEHHSSSNQNLAVIVCSKLSTSPQQGLFSSDGYSLYRTRT